MIVGEKRNYKEVAKLRKYVARPSDVGIFRHSDKSLDTFEISLHFRIKEMVSQDLLMPIVQMKKAEAYS